MQRRRPIVHAKPKKNEVFITCQHPSRYCKRVIDLLKQHESVRLYGSGAAIQTLCQIKMELERLLYLPVEVPGVISRLHVTLETYTIEKPRQMSGMALTVRAN